MGIVITITMIITVIANRIANRRIAEGRSVSLGYGQRNGDGLGEYLLKSRLYFLDFSLGIAQ